MPNCLVLVVDDTPTWREDFEGYIRRLGYDVITATNGAEAIAAIEANPAIAAVVTDTQMPNGDGITILQFLDARHPQLPTLILSSYHGYTYRGRDVELGPFVEVAFGSFAKFVMKDLQWIGALRYFLAEKVPLAP